MVLFNLTFVQLTLYALVAYLIAGISRAVYNCFFHPLSKIPGPWIRHAFYFPSYWEVFTGDIVFNWHAMHEQYGDMVRINPHWVSVIKPDAWRDIYAQTGTKKPIPKDPEIYFRGPDSIGDIVSSTDAEHSRMRRALNPAFSEKALQSQESIINSYISLLIQKLHVKASTNTPVNLMKWLNFTTFDLLGDLCFDETFGTLEKEDYNVWISNVFKGLKIFRVFRPLKAYPILRYPLFGLLSLFPQLNEARKKHEQYTNDKTERRLNSKTERKDIMSYVLKQDSDKGMTHEEIKKTTGILIIAGSETSATLLSGAFFYLLKNPEWMKKLQHEIRTTFPNESDLTFTALAQQKIMHAVIMETFRLYPPVPTTLPRLVSQEGATVCGVYLPPGTSVGVAQYPANHSSHNFTDPETYAPERFLGHPKYADDNRSVIQPFSVGPRNCIGQNIAWAEIRMILARLVWNFEIELEGENEHWDKQKVFVLWDKPSLMVKLTPRKV
ncbi:cytochrome P450 monooxygenase-like protein [Amniculicola lignicola CBS 123094]|uniref:Cytochrome P450 monooxygenase-like protein n=1 Tax=Amniculicola lignicola CBS 123094 TaxID=1392246 RepID=A0A6A5W575_9PLEO|nr:cytochrome P450 monooxygenase-like protein [Amniculicola lignicola CBS 123094]